jgi:hypothetical protein
MAQPFCELHARDVGLRVLEPRDDAFDRMLHCLLMANELAELIDVQVSAVHFLSASG